VIYPRGSGWRARNLRPAPRQGHCPVPWWRNNAEEGRRASVPPTDTGLRTTPNESGKPEGTCVLPTPLAPSTPLCRAAAAPSRAASHTGHELFYRDRQPEASSRHGSSAATGRNFQIAERQRAFSGRRILRDGNDHLDIGPGHQPLIHPVLGQDAAARIVVLNWFAGMRRRWVMEHGRERASRRPPSPTAYTIERWNLAQAAWPRSISPTTQADRDVAIKVLHHDLGAALGPDRF